MSDTVWMEHLVCAWHQTCSIGLGQIMKALSTSSVLTDSVLAHSSTSSRACSAFPKRRGEWFLLEGCHCGDVNCLPSDDCWVAPSSESLPMLDGTEWTTFPWPSLLGVGPPAAQNALTMHSELFVLSLYFGSTCLPSLYMFCTYHYSSRL